MGQADRKNPDVFTGQTGFTSYSHQILLRLPNVLSSLRRFVLDTDLPTAISPWRMCTAPMMDWSDRHCRYFWRLMTKYSRFYTEMVTSGALIHGNRERFLRYHPVEHPIALQLGGHCPADLARCAQLAEDAGFDEVNLNCGCPSDRVQEGRIGACLMAEPDLVAECVQKMQSVVKIPVTVKHRLGIDDLDSQEHLYHFVEALYQAGCRTFIIHARKAWLNGLSPKENREVPPLEYERVFDIKQRYNDITVVINGGIRDLSTCTDLLQHVDGVMLGREAYQNPFFLTQVDTNLFGQPDYELNRQSIIEAYMEYCREELTKGVRLHHLTRHILGIFNGQPGARLFRQHLSLHANKPGADISVLRDALNIQKYEQDRWQTKLSPANSACAQTKLQG